MATVVRTPRVTRRRVAVPAPPPVRHRPGLTVAVVGAGVAGLAAAIRLRNAGAEVVVCDPSPTPGGLAGGFSVGGCSVEKFYHHLFRSDRCAVRWIEAMGLKDALEYLPASMGMYHDGRLHPFGTAMSLLRFSPLPPLDRVRLGLRARRLGRTASCEDFEQVTALDWLRERATPRELEVFWIPMLEAKFGADLDRVSMAWLWARFRARVADSNGGGERLGYLRGGFQQLSDRMAERAASMGVSVRLGQGVSHLLVDGEQVGGLACADGTRVGANAVVWTPSLPALLRSTPQLNGSFRSTVATMRAHTAVVMVVELDRSVLPYYWVNIADRTLPFTVAVEHTRLVGTEDYGGKVIVYLGRYAAPEDEITTVTDETVRGRFLDAAARAFSPAFRSPLASHVFRAPSAQPIVPPGWGSDRPPMRAGLSGLYAANMAQIYPWDRGVNYSLELGEQAAAAVMSDLG